MYHDQKFIIKTYTTLYVNRSQHSCEKLNTAYNAANIINEKFHHLNVSERLSRLKITFPVLQHTSHNGAATSTESEGEGSSTLLQEEDAQSMDNEEALSGLYDGSGLEFDDEVLHQGRAIYQDNGMEDFGEAAMEISKEEDEPAAEIPVIEEIRLAPPPSGGSA